MKFIILVCSFLLGHAYAQRPRSEVLCYPSLKVQEFVSQNEDIILVANSRDFRSELIAVEGFKGSVPSNYSLAVKHVGGWSARDVDQKIENYIWGIKTIKDIHSDKLDSTNCLPIEEINNVRAEVKKWETKNRSPLYVALKDYDLKKALQLIAKKSYKTPIGDIDELHDLVIELFPELAKPLFDSGYPMEYIKWRSTPLFSAVYYGRYDIIKDVLKRKANPDYIAPLSKVMPLQIAIMTKDHEAVKLLLEGGAKIQKDSICYLQSYQEIPDERPFENYKDRNKTAMLLINHGASLDYHCPGDTNPNPIRTITTDAYLETLKYLLDSKKITTIKSADGYEHLTIKELWKRGMNFEKVRKEELDAARAITDYTKVEKDKLGQYLRLAINFKEFDLFKKIVDSIKPNIKFPYSYGERKYCSIESLVSNDFADYFEYAYKAGMDIDKSCSNYFGSQNVFDDILTTCSDKILQLLSDKDIERMKKRPLQGVNFSPSTNCLSTFQFLKKHNFSVEEDKLLRKYLERGSTFVTREIVERKVLEKATLEAAFHNYAKIESHFPIKQGHDDWQIKGVSSFQINYLFHLLKPYHFKEKQKINLAFDFQKGASYPLCGSSGQLVFYKNPEMTEKREIIEDCLILKPQEISYFEISDVAEKHFEVISVSGRTIGNRYYIKKDSAAPLYYVKSKKHNYPVTLAAPKEITLDSKGLNVKGDEDFCLGLGKPQLKNFSESESLQSTHAMSKEKDCQVKSASGT